MMKRAVVAFLFFVLPVVGLADERILSFASDISIFVDGGMRVRETIRVRAEGVNIRRGIFRDFPTDYRDRIGNRYRVGFDVLGVTRDGRPESYRRESMSNGVRIYIGDANVFLAAGEYEYELTYRTTRQLGFFEDHDELYWNVTGNGWDFPIDQASARVELPAPVPVNALTIEGYVGPTGSTDRSVNTEIGGQGIVTIAAARPLGAREGLTLVATWPKGLIPEPTAAQRTARFFGDNLGLLVALVAFVSAFVYLLHAWRKVGRDPAPGVIFPHYVPPDGISPAAMRYITRMGYDKKAFTAAVLSMAVKGYLEIKESKKKYTLSRTHRGKGELTKAEKVLYDKLFSAGDEVLLKNENHAVLGKAMRAHGKVLDRSYNRVYFNRNLPFILPAILILGLGFAIVFMFAQATVPAVLVMIPAALTIVVFFFLLRAPTTAGRKLLDQIEGFRMYLDIAEKDDLELRHPPEKTPQLFEAYLPYALALGVEQSWAEQFADVFAQLEERTGAPYQPGWYQGRWQSSGYGGSVRGMNAMTSSLGSAISSASTPPGSSSGSGGGGSSGGGGGGGGGGGW
jgi:uncharacterized protein (TIGR04222 family)